MLGYSTAKPLDAQSAPHKVKPASTEEVGLGEGVGVGVEAAVGLRVGLGAGTVAVIALVGLGAILLCALEELL